MRMFGLNLSLGKKSAAAVQQGALPAGGRSSAAPSENLEGVVASLQTTFGGLQPYDPQLLGLMERLALYGPVISHAVKLLASTVNNGHDLILEGPKRKVTQAQEMLGELARRAYPRSAGIDGLINHYTRQLAISGALASEDVLLPDLSALAEVVLLPASSIRWNLVEGRWQAFQQNSSGAGDLELNKHTFTYYALDTLIGHPPYGVPPFLSVLGPEEVMQDILTNLKFYAKKLGLYGITDIGVPPPERQAGESEHEFNQRAQKFINDTAAAYSQAYTEGMIVRPSNHEFAHRNISGAAFQVSKIIQNIEQLMMNGLGIDPAMFGRSFSTTETYAGVVYNLLLKYAAQYQRLIKRRMERTYRLALLLAGLWDVEPGLQWKPQPELKPEQAANAESTRTNTAITKAEKGIIDPDQAAQELGYEQAADPERLLAGQTQAGQAGQMVRLVLSSDGDGYRRPHLGRQGKDDEPLDDERAIRAEADALAARYGAGAARLADPIRAQALDAVEELLAASGELSAEEFAQAVHARLAETYGMGWATPAVKAAVTSLVEPVYKHYRLLSDLAGIGKREWTWGGPERRVLDFARKVDRHYFGKYLNNADAQRRAMRVLKDQWLDKGAGLFGRADPEAIAKFRKEMEQELRLLDNQQIQRIVDTSVQRLRNWGNVQQLAEAGAVWATVWAILDGSTSDICREMHGRKIKVAEASAEVEYLAGLSPKEFEAHLKKGRALSAQGVRGGGVGGLLAQGKAVPPYHIGCRTRLKMALSPPPQAGEPPEELNAAQERSWRYWQELPEGAKSFRRADAQGGDWLNERLARRHAADHLEVAPDLEGYKAALAGLQAKPKRVLLRLGADADLQMALVGGGEKDWRMALIDLDQRIAGGAARVKTLYGPSGKYDYDWSKQKNRLASGGWVEVES